MLAHRRAHDSERAGSESDRLHHALISTIAADDVTEAQATHCLCQTTLAIKHSRELEDGSERGSEADPAKQRSEVEVGK